MMPWGRGGLSHRPGDDPSIQLQTNVKNGAIAPVLGHGEAQFTAHLEHDVVLVENLAVDPAESLGSRIANHPLHQYPAKASPLEVRAQKDGIFADLVVRIDVQ